MCFRKQNFIFVFLLFFSSYSYSQNFSVFGYVKDSSNFENLQGVNIIIENTKSYATSNRYGFYSITLPMGDYQIRYAYVGYELVKIKVQLNENKEINILLPVSYSKIDEVVVTSTKNNILKNNKIGFNSISTQQIKEIPTIAGESDVMKSIQLLPGIQVSNEGSSNFNVRGGSFDQNLILLDEAPVYNPSHALGFFSTFNPDAISNVDLYKGVFPSQYGGRISSVVDISMKEGNKQHFNTSGSVGTIASRVSIEGPIIKEKGSFLLTGRYSYAGKVLNMLTDAGKTLKMSNLSDLTNKNDIRFYDLNFKINYEFNSKNRLFLSFFTGNDFFYGYSLDNSAALTWGNTTSTLRWNHIYSPKMFSNIVLTFSNYNYSYYLKDDIRNFKWSSDMSELGLKADFDYFITPTIKIKSGLFTNYHSFSPGKIEPRDTTSVIKSFSLDKKHSLDAGAFVNVNYSLNDNILIDAGFRYSYFFNLGPGWVYSYNQQMTHIIDSSFYTDNKVINTYYEVEPRILLRYILNQDNTIKLGYGYTSQYLHLLGNSSVGLPTDVWLPPDKYILPQSAHQFSLGYYSIITTSNIEFSVEGYYKRMLHIIDYIDNADLFLNPHLETITKAGTGKSYGLEFFVQKNHGKLTGWAGYTLSKTTYKINGLNNNKSFNTRYDIRHNISLTGNYKLNNSWSISSVYKITSGGFITIPQGNFYFQGVKFNYYSDRNGYQLPIYHRMDLALNYKSSKNRLKRYQSEWSFSVYNVYAHKNTFSLFIRQDPNDLGNNKAYKMYIFSFVPSITYSFKY
jgi:hypothetical protein